MDHHLTKNGKRVKKLKTGYIFMKYPFNDQVKSLSVMEKNIESNEKKRSIASCVLAPTSVCVALNEPSDYQVS